MAGSVGSDHFAGNHLIVFYFVNLKILCFSKMLENIPVIVCNCNFHLTKSSVVFFLRLFFLHKGFNLVWITHQILGKNLASVLCNQDIILDPDSDLPLALRNNITTDECPLGVYHPHAQYHHIKKENIGLIEVMGLAILPARLKDELEELSKCLVEGKDVRAVAELEKHADWVDEFLPRHPELNSENVMDILKEEVGKVFVGVLEDAGVYKCTEEGRSAFAKFMETL